jgi:nicotinamidase-related amidase
MRITTRPAIVVLALATILGLHGAIAADKQDTAKHPVKSELSIDRGRTAVLIMDYENQILGMLPEKTQAAVLDNASAILKQARQAHLPIIYVVVRFRDGYPEVSRQNKRFAGLKESGRLREGTPGAEIHARVAPQPGDIVVTKRRVGAFSTTDLESILRANNISTLAMFGISTSGVVLSTVRWAADMDYQLVVVSDACADMDDEVHRVLAEKVLSAQATVVSTQEFTKALAAKTERGGK